MSEYTLNFDGATEPCNPGGISTFGFVLKEGEKVVLKGKGIAAEPGTPGSTNNVSEYTALLKGIEACKSVLKPGDKVTFMGDSQLVIRQVAGQYAVNAPTLIPLYRKAAIEVANFRNSGIPVGLQWIPRELNGEADQLSKEAIKDLLKEDPALLDKIVMSYGKHQGKKLSEIPKSYLDWLWNKKS